MRASAQYESSALITNQCDSPDGTRARGCTRIDKHTHTRTRRILCTYDVLILILYDDCRKLFYQVIKIRIKSLKRKIPRVWWQLHQKIKIRALYHGPFARNVKVLFSVLLTFRIYIRKLLVLCVCVCVCFSSGTLQSRSFSINPRRPV